MNIQTSEIGQAFANRERFTSYATQSSGNELLHHGSKIAWFNGDRLCFSLCGWNSVTTRKRLSDVVYAYCGGWICQRGHEPYFMASSRELIAIDECKAYRVARNGALVEEV